MRVLMLLPAMLLGCAQTNLYSPTGKKLASLQGDYTGLRYAATGPGYSVTLSADTAIHSVATKAQGEAAHSVLGGVSTLTTSTGVAIATSGLVPAVK